MILTTFSTREEFDSSQTLIKHCLSVSALMVSDGYPFHRNEAWMTLESWNAQLGFLEELVHIESSAALDIACFTELFQLSLSPDRTHRVKAQRRQQLLYHLPILDKDRNLSYTR
jgi:hypothetical protein